MPMQEAVFFRRFPGVRSWCPPTNFAQVYVFPSARECPNGDPRSIDLPVSAPQTRRFALDMKVFAVKSLRVGKIYMPNSDRGARR